MSFENNNNNRKVEAQTTDAHWKLTAEEESSALYLSILKGVTELPIQYPVVTFMDVARAAGPVTDMPADRSGRVSDTSPKSPEKPRSLLERMYDCTKKDLIEDARKSGMEMKVVDQCLQEFEGARFKYGRQRQMQMILALENLRQIVKPNEGTTPPFSSVLRKEMFITGLKNISAPEEICQGYHPTCNVATIEVHAAARAPGEYTRLLKEVALTGKYQTADGKIVTPPRAALLPGDDERTYDIKNPDLNRRNYASQIVSMTLINGLYETGGVVKDGRAQTDVRYVLHPVSWEPVPGMPGAKRKVAEDRLVDRDGRVIGRAKDDGPSFTVAEILGASKMMLGYEMPYINGPYSRDGGRTWVYSVPSQEGLVRAKENFQFPLGVPTMGGAHVQTIHDVYRDKTGTFWVKLDNQNGKDGWVTYADLVRTMKHDVELKPTIRRWQHPSKVAH